MKNTKYILLLTALSLFSTPVVFAANQPENTTILTKSANIDSDIVIKTKLLTTYSLNPELRKYNIVVDVSNGIVHLDGAVRNEPQKELAINIAKDVEGVNTVTENLIVDKNTKAGEISADYGQKVYDATLTAMVKSRLLLNPKINGAKVKVTTVNDIATLEGEVPSLAQKQMIGRIAIKTPGVVAVKNNLQVQEKS